MTDESESNASDLKTKAALRLAERQWEAAQENARRLASRTNSIMAAVAVVSGFGFLKIPDISAMQPLWLSLALRFLIAVVALFAFLGLVLILDVRPPPPQEDEPKWRVFRRVFRWIRKRLHTDGKGPEDRSKHPFASSYLHCTADPSEGEGVQDPDLLTLQLSAIEETEYYRLAMAALELHVRNVERQAGLVQGQGWLARAAFLGFLIAAVLGLAR